MGNGCYVYKEDDLFQEDLYLKKRLMGFVKERGALLLRMRLHENARNKPLIPVCCWMHVPERKGRLFLIHLGFPWLL